MFGYIRPSKPHLSEQDEARFQSVYCGLCHELGRKYGFAARFVLNFDFTFLAILLSDAQEPECESCRCAAHPCKAQCVMAHTGALETAADHSLVLAWWQLRDHIEDHGFFKAIPVDGGSQPHPAVTARRGRSCRNLMLPCSGT